MAKILPKNEVAKLLDELIKDYTVIAPTREKSFILLKEISSSSEVDLSLYNTRVNTKIPPKECILPQTEVLYSYVNTESGIQLMTPPVDDRNKIIFGIRACDAKSFLLMDKFFSGREFDDKYFTQKRKNMLLIGMACNDPLSTCFCTSVGGHPHAKDGLDIQLVDINDKYLVEAVSDKGTKLLGKVSWLKDAGSGDLDKGKELAKKAEDAMKKLPIDKITITTDDLFNDPVWVQFVDKCVGCSVCTFVCPTCHCFDVVDEPTANGGKRIRIWDSCQLPLFTLHGSGHNPRPAGKERMRQRIMHKFNYYPHTLNEIGCVGCGRCVISCPVNQDIREALKKLMEVGGEKA